MASNDHPPRLPEPSTPFTGVRCHFSSPELGIYAWFVANPDGWICRYSPGMILTEEMAQFVATKGEVALLSHFPSTAKFLFVQDFADMTSYEGGARKIFTDWGMRISRRTLRTVVIPPPMTPMFRMGLHTAMLALRLAGIQMETCSDLKQAIKKYNLSPDPRANTP